MRLDFDVLKNMRGFSKLSDEAKEFIRTYCELGEVRFCDTCGKFLEGEFVADTSPDSQDFCSIRCMEDSGYSQKELLCDYYQIPEEGEEGYDEVMEAKSNLNADDFERWLMKRYPENIDAPVFLTEDQFPTERDDWPTFQALSWLRKINVNSDVSRYMKAKIGKELDGIKMLNSIILEGVIECDPVFKMEEHDRIDLCTFRLLTATDTTAFHVEVRVYEELAERVHDVQYFGKGLRVRALGELNFCGHPYLRAQHIEYRRKKRVTTTETIEQIV